MASNLIRRDALLDSLKESKEGLRKIYDGLQYENEKRICSAEIMSFIEAILRVQEAPAVDAEPVRHGEWARMVYIDTGKFAGYKCSECGLIAKRKFSYCHCGAKMDGGKEDATV